jgi:hypothetical protein
MQFASWSYDGLLVNLVAPDGGADLTNYVPVSFFLFNRIYRSERKNYVFKKPIVIKKG